MHQKKVYITLRPTNKGILAYKKLLVKTVALISINKGHPMQVLNTPPRHSLLENNVDTVAFTLLLSF